jgi:hypothetical protein
MHMARRVTPSRRPRVIGGRELRPLSQIPTGWFQGLRTWRVQGRALALLPARIPQDRNGHEVYRAARAAGAPIVRTRRPADRRSRSQRWNDTIAALVDLQAEYDAWLNALPDNQHESTTAEALRAIVELDLSELQAIEPPRGFGRD